MIVEGVCLEETCDCDKAPLPFRFKYLFTKDPCEKCLVRPSCNRKCEPKYAHWDQLHSIKEWKKKWKRNISKPLNIATILFVISASLLLIMVSGCRQVNQERAVQYYDQEVKNFPNSNE